eukprot:scaffold208169_cov16-Attheya_sp.AAC.1
MSSYEENDTVEVGVRNTAVAAASAKKNNNITDWEALNVDNVGVISEFRERVATLNKIASNLEAEVRVAQGQAQHAQNNGIDTTIEMDAVEYDR